MKPFAVTTIALIATNLAIAPAALAQEKKTITLMGVEKNRNSCDKQPTYNVEIFADRILMSGTAAAGGSGVVETFTANADGVFAKEFRSPKGPRFRVEGSLKSRQIRVLNLGATACIWEGTF
jgi:hypothetical protein